MRLPALAGFALAGLLAGCASGGAGGGATRCGPTEGAIVSWWGAPKPMLEMRDAIKKGDAEAVQRLLSGGYDVDRCFPDGSPPLHLAVALGQEDIARLLVAAGADIEIKGYDDRTSFEHAMAMREPDIAKYLKEQQLKRRGAVAAAAPAPGAGAGVVSREDVTRMVAEAIAARSKAKQPAAVRSDSDTPSYKLPEDPDKFALVVGVEKYLSLPDATFARRDAEAVRDHLLALGYPQRNVVLLTDSQATKTNWTKYLEAWLPEKVSERSTVFVFYSGHGAPDVATGQAYLVPVEGDPQYLEVSALRLEHLYERLAALKAKRVIVALDSCFSGAGGRSVLPKGARPLVSRLDTGRLSPRGKIIALSASAADEISGTLDAQGHGAFTYFLLKGLNGAATDPAGATTLQGLFDYLRPKVADAAREQNRDQTPALQPEASGLRRLRLR